MSLAAVPENRPPLAVTVASRQRPLAAPVSQEAGKTTPVTQPAPQSPVTSDLPLRHQDPVRHDCSLA